MQDNDDLQAQLEDTRQKLKETQNSQNQIIKSNKRMSSVLTNSGSQSKRKRQDILELSRQQK